MVKVNPPFAPIRHRRTHPSKALAAPHPHPREIQPAWNAGLAQDLPRNEWRFFEHQQFLIQRIQMVNSHGLSGITDESGFWAASSYHCRGDSVVRLSGDPAGTWRGVKTAKAHRTTAPCPRHRRATAAVTLRFAAWAVANVPCTRILRLIRRRIAQRALVCGTYTAKRQPTHGKKPAKRSGRECRMSGQWPGWLRDLYSLSVAMVLSIWLFRWRAGAPYTAWRCFFSAGADVSEQERT